MINIYTSHYDRVITSHVLTGDITYANALTNILPLTNRFDAQRKILDSKFYMRLRRDIIQGCMMPPITLAFVNEEISENTPSDISKLTKYVNHNISKGYILDGLQRLNTLKSASSDSKFPKNQKLLLNIIIAGNEDKLLYRMITLNNGQKPMSPRHQIEILTQELFSFENYPNLIIQTEKEKSKKSVAGSYSFADISKAYLAFITNSPHVDNNKFIAEKMDQILVGKILDVDMSATSIEFKDVLLLLNRYQANTYLKDWFKLGNNLIGFCVGARQAFEFLASIEDHALEYSLKQFETALKALNPSKVNLGKIRRDLVNYFIANIKTLNDKSSDDLMEIFAAETAQ